MIGKTREYKKPYKLGCRPIFKKIGPTMDEKNSERVSNRWNCVGDKIYNWI